MILTVDIGNSNITLGGFIEDELRVVAKVSTVLNKTSDEYASTILSTLSIHGAAREDIDGAIISSVVPALTSVIRNSIRFICGKDPLLVGPGIKTGISIHCDTPSSVGADLICASAAAHYIYGSPSLIVDMGTATKMILVKSGGVFVGVSIIPGVPMGQNGLCEMTAQLPQVSLDAPGAVIGKNTADAMRSGLIFGHAAMVDGMIDRIKEQAGEELSVITTGAYAELIMPHCKRDMQNDPDLVLKGLNIIYKRNN